MSTKNRKVLIKQRFGIITDRDCLTVHVDIISVTKDLLVQFYCVFYINFLCTHEVDGKAYYGSARRKVGMP